MFLIINKHNRIKALLSAYLDDELKESERKLVEKHLASCYDCTQKLESLRAAVGLLKALPLASPGRSFLVQAEKKSKPRPTPPVWQPIPVPVIITALLTLALFLGDFFQALPYSEERIIKPGVSAPAPMVVTEAKPQAASVTAPTSSPAAESPRILQPAAAREAQVEKALPEGKESPTAIPETAKALSSGKAAAGAAPAGPPGPARPAALSGPAGQDIKPEAPSINAPASATGEPQGTEALAPEARPLPQPTPAPVPVPQTLLPEAPVKEPSVKASPPASRKEISIDKVPANDSGSNFFIIPWRLVEILFLIITILLIVHTILKKKKSQKEINSF